MKTDKLILCVAEGGKAYPIILSDEQEQLLLLLVRSLGELKVIPNNYFEYESLTVKDVKEKLKGGKNE